MVVVYQVATAVAVNGAAVTDVVKRAATMVEVLVAVVATMVVRALATVVEATAR